MIIPIIVGITDIVVKVPMLYTVTEFPSTGTAVSMAEDRLTLN